MVSIEKLAALTPESGDLLCTEIIGEQHVQVRQLGNLRWMNFGDVPLQSIILIEDPARLIFPYTEAMMAAFLFCEHPVKLLNLGFGGGCLERFLWSVNPEILIVSVESSEAVISLSKRYFSIPESFQVSNLSAEAYLNQSQGQYSIIFCDIFDADGHPPCMTDPVFFSKVYEHLCEDGVAVFNTIVSSEQDLIDILLPLRLSFPWVCLLDLPRLNNVLLFASRQKPPVNAIFKNRAEKLANIMGIDLCEVAEHLKLLPKSRAT